MLFILSTIDKGRQIENYSDTADFGIRGRCQSCTHDLRGDGEVKMTIQKSKAFFFRNQT